MTKPRQTRIWDAIDALSPALAALSDLGFSPEEIREAMARLLPSDYSRRVPGEAEFARRSIATAIRRWQKSEANFIAPTKPAGQATLDEFIRNGGTVQALPARFAAGVGHQPQSKAPAAKPPKPKLSLADLDLSL